MIGPDTKKPLNLRMGDDYAFIFIMCDLDEKMEDGSMGGACSTFSLQADTNF